MVAPTKAVKLMKMATAKHKVASHVVTQQCTHKVTRVASPSPEAVVKELTRFRSPSPEATNEALPAAGPSGSTRPPLFEAVALSGNEEVMGWGAVTPGGSSEYLVTVPLRA